MARTLHLIRSKAAELAAIGCALMTNEGAASVAGALTVDDFVGPEHRAAFEAIRSLVTSGGRVDTVLLAAEMQSREIDYETAVHLAVDATQAVPDAANVDHYCRLLREKRRVRQLAEASEEISKLVGQHGEAADLVTEAQSRFLRLEAGDPDAAETIGQIVDAAVSDTFNAHEKGEPPMVRTGLADIDAVIGGFRPGELIIVAAGPGVGKTAFALQVGVSAAEAGKVAHFFSLEMPRRDLGLRALAQRTGISTDALRSGRVDRDRWPRLYSGRTELEGLRLVIHDEPRVRIDELRSLLLRESIGPRRPDLVIIDYAQLVLGEGGQKFGTREQEVSNVARNMKLIARELSAPVLALAQINRSVDAGVEPQLSSLRESGALEANADMVIFLHRPDWGSRPSDVDCLVRKNRSGPLGRVSLRFDPATTKFAGSS